VSQPWRRTARDSFFADPHVSSLEKGKKAVVAFGNG
jgi:hypothetical protein